MSIADKILRSKQDFDDVYAQSYSRGKAVGYDEGYERGKAEGGGGETVPTYDGEVEVV